MVFYNRQYHMDEFNKDAVHIRENKCNQIKSTCRIVTIHLEELVTTRYC